MRKYLVQIEEQRNESRWRKNTKILIYNSRYEDIRFLPDKDNLKHVWKRVKFLTYSHNNFFTKDHPSPIGIKCQHINSFSALPNNTIQEFYLWLLDRNFKGKILVTASVISWHTIKYSFEAFALFSLSYL